MVKGNDKAGAQSKKLPLKVAKMVKGNDKAGAQSKKWPSHVFKKGRAGSSSSLPVSEPAICPVCFGHEPLSVLVCCGHTCCTECWGAIEVRTREHRDVKPCPAIIDCPVCKQHIVTAEDYGADWSDMNYMQPVIYFAHSQ